MAWITVTEVTGAAPIETLLNTDHILKFQRWPGESFTRVFVSDNKQPISVAETLVDIETLVSAI